MTLDDIPQDSHIHIALKQWAAIARIDALRFWETSLGKISEECFLNH